MLTISHVSCFWSTSVKSRSSLPIVLQTSPPTGRSIGANEQKQVRTWTSATKNLKDRAHNANNKIRFVMVQLVPSCCAVVEHLLPHAALGGRRFLWPTPPPHLFLILSSGTFWRRCLTTLHDAAYAPNLFYAEKIFKSFLAEATALWKHTPPSTHPSIQKLPTLMANNQQHPINSISGNDPFCK